MVAYSFQPGFLGQIQAGTKRQTIRIDRKRHARPGEALQFFTGPRMRPTRVGFAECRRVREVRLDFPANTVTLDEFEVIDATDGFDALNAFAIRDGFDPPERAAWRCSPWEFMGCWWRLTHPDQPVFRGVLVDWDDTFTPAIKVAA